MSEAFTSYSIANDEKFRAAIEKVRGVTDDLRIPLTLITKDFEKSEKGIFMLQSSGQYPDFGGFNPNKKVKYKGVEMTRREMAKKKKFDKVGFVYPLLRGKNKAIETSLTDSTDRNAVRQIIEKRTLIIGSTVPYIVYHQSDRPRHKIPQRKVLFIGPEAPKFATSEQTGRLQRWLGILDDFLVKQMRRKYGG